MADTLDDLNKLIFQVHTCALAHTQIILKVYKHSFPRKKDKQIKFFLISPVYVSIIIKFTFGKE